MPTGPDLLSLSHRHTMMRYKRRRGGRIERTQGVYQIFGLLLRVFFAHTHTTHCDNSHGTRQHTYLYYNSTLIHLSLWEGGEERRLWAKSFLCILSLPSSLFCRNQLGVKQLPVQKACTHYALWWIVTQLQLLIRNMPDQDDDGVSPPPYVTSSSTSIDDGTTTAQFFYFIIILRCNREKEREGSVLVLNYLSALLLQPSTGCPPGVQEPSRREASSSNS